MLNVFFTTFVLHLMHRTKPHFFISLIFLLISGLCFGNDIDSLKTLLYDAHEAERKIELFTLLSKSYLPVDDNEARNYAKQAFNLSESTHTDTYSAEIFSLLGDIAVRNDSLLLAKSYYNKALGYYQELSQQSDLIGIYVVLGNIALTFDDFSSAMAYYHKAIDYALINNDIESLSSIYLNIGTIHFYSGRTIESQEYFLEALNGFLKIGDTALVADAYINLGHVYLKLGDYITARKYMNKSIKIFKDKNLITRLSQAYQGLALVNQMELDYQAAIENLKIAAKYLEELNPAYLGPKQAQWATNYINLGKSYFLSGNNSKAYGSLLEAFRISRTNRQLQIAKGAAYYLSILWEDEGNVDSAYYYHKQFHAYSDSLKNEDNIRSLAVQEADFKHRQELLIAKQEQEKQANINSRNRVIFIVAIIVLLLISLILILFLKLSQNKTKQALIEQKSLKNELELRNRELSSQLNYQVQNNEFILNISKRIKKLYADAKPGNKTMLNEIIRELEADASNRQWDEFESRFQQVHQDFYKNLGEKYPDLTTNELRLCTFLKLNMNTKDIAAITYQTTNSVTVARWRLRQKLGLKKDETLSSFLTKF